MSDPIDPILARLTAMTTPAALDDLEADVFAAIDERAHGQRSGRRIGTLAVAAALAAGLVGGGMTGGGIAPAQAAVPIGMDAALAPSTLLLGR